MTSSSLALHCDFYQLTMAAAYYAQGLNGPATFSLFVHGLPPQRGYMVAAGLQPALDYLAGLSFDQADLDYLASLGRFDSDFLHMLSQLSFGGQVWAMPEGTVCFAGEPLLEVTASLIEAQLVETYLINTINLHTTLASKAARCVLAAQGRRLVDFGLRRTHGVSGGLAAARSSALAGFEGTSNVAAAREYGLVPVGTMAHAFIEAFGQELTAFRAFADTFGDYSVFLIDTYDTESGLEHAMAVARELEYSGHQALGVRLDSGDLVQTSRQVRSRLQKAGLDYLKVVASGNLDEHRIADLLSGGAQIDIFGVGTRMGSSADIPYLDFAYKLVNYQGRPTLKLSEGKVTWVGAKQVWRTLDSDGLIAGDLLGLRSEEHAGRTLLQPVIQEGRRLGPGPSLEESRQYCQEELATLPEPCRRLNDPQSLTYQPSEALRSLQEETRQQTLARQTPRG